MMVFATLVDYWPDYLPGLLTAWGIQLVAVSSPGPAVAVILGIATAQGRTPALITSAGIACAAALIACATVLGLSTLVADISGLLTVVRIVGATYLAWLSWQAWRKAIHPPAIAVTPRPALSMRRTFLTGLFLQLSNPKAIVFWLAIASVGATAGAPVAVCAVFVAGVFTISLVGHGAYALLLSAQPVRALYDRARRGVEAALGTVLALAAFKLAITRS